MEFPCQLLDQTFRAKALKMKSLQIGQQLMLMEMAMAGNSLHGQIILAIMVWPRLHLLMRLVLLLLTIILYQDKSVLLQI